MRRISKSKPTDLYVPSGGLWDVRNNRVVCFSSGYLFAMRFCIFPYKVNSNIIAMLFICDAVSVAFALQGSVQTAAKKTLGLNIGSLP